MAFARPQRARLPFAPLARAEMTTLQGSLHAADRPVALASRFDDGISPSAGDRAIGDPGVSPDETRTRWLTKACRSVSLRSSPPPSFTCPSCLGTLGPDQVSVLTATSTSCFVKRPMSAFPSKSVLCRCLGTKYSCNISVLCFTLLLSASVEGYMAWFRDTRHASGA